MHIRTKYHPATNTKGSRVSVTLHDFNGDILARSFISMGEVEYYNWSSIREQVLYCLERFFEKQRKAKQPLFMGNNPIDRVWDWQAIQLNQYDFIFVDSGRVTVAHTIKYMRHCIVESVKVLTPNK